MPKYPFTPELLDALPEILAEHFRALELALLEGICSRLNLTKQLNEVTVQNIRALRDHRIDLKEIEKAIREYSDISEKELKKLLDDVVQRNQKYHTEVIDLAKVTKPPYLVNSADIEMIRKQALDEISNLTRSMGFLVDGGKTFLPPAKAYQWALDHALLKIESGAYSYNDAIGSAVMQLADSGLIVFTDEKGRHDNIVQYESGHKDQLDVAVRRAVMTGVNQINQKYREESLNYLETDLVEVTAHMGARDIDGPKGWENHKKWQGRVYRWKRNGNNVQQNTNGTQHTYTDITGKWYPNSTPGSHEVEDASEITINGTTYKVDGRNVQLTYSQHEKEIAELLEREVGGELKMLPRVNNPQGVSTPDYLFNGKGYDLKTLKPDAGKNTIYNRIKKSRDQALNFVIDITKSGLDELRVNEQIEKIFRMKETSFVDEIVIVSGDKIIRVIKKI